MTQVFIGNQWAWGSLSWGVRKYFVLIFTWNFFSWNLLTVRKILNNLPYPLKGDFFSRLYLCVLSGLLHVDFSALIFVSFQHGQKSHGEVTTGLILDNVLQLCFVL